MTRLDRSATLGVPAPKKGSHPILYSFGVHDIAALPLDGVSQGLIFECGTGPNNEQKQEFILSFRRYFFVPFDDDPAVFYQLCFEVCVCYIPDSAFEPWSLWFQVEAEADLAQAADRFVQRVEELHDLWQLLSGHQPAEVYLFQ